MKNLLAASASILVSLNCFAGVTKINRQDAGLYTAPVTIASVQKSICPPNALCQQAETYVATLLVEVEGCFDRLGSFSSNVSLDASGKEVFNVSAVVLKSKTRSSVNCLSEPINIVIESFSPDVKINDLNAK